MELNKFQELSKRTMPFKGEPKNNIEYENGLTNYAMGLIGECAEVLSAANERDATLKELGDVSHYAFGILTLLGEKYEPLDNYFVEGSKEKLIDKIIILSGEISEQVKKFVFHRHELNSSKVKIALKMLIKNLIVLAEKYETTLEEICEMNIDKLKKRYPESFNVEDSKKRVDTVQ
ncbi:hypothetical protein C7Y47_22130 [Lysinibacillus sphaericus]|uniref:Nucleotide pyrophosphohydrolase n=1 Tax=Lysinibacillus sphaericus TaxID=1421 RepID=A0A544U8B9_LYSSH|nr:hypothetical protein [Lysinibacillus sp. SDF0037]TQR28341.1 hypothetical protein C7Y47_22130 [Lysinibacillus sp. SDF0037]